MKMFFTASLLLSSSLLFAGTCAEDYPNDREGQQSCERNRSQGAASATNGNGNNNNNNNGNGNASSNNVPYNTCEQHYTRARAAIGPRTLAVPTQFYAAENSVALVTPVVPAPVPAPTWIGIEATLNPNLKLCRGLDAVAENISGGLISTDQKSSQDRKINCVQKSGITADWESCVSALGMYNAIVVAEAAMQVLQGVQQNRAEAQAQNQYTTRSAQGDAQNAAYDAQVAQVNSARQLNQTQAAAYAAAVAALYSKIQSWIKESEDAFLQKGCAQPAQARTVQRPPAQTANPTPELYASVEAVPKAANCVDSAKQAFRQYQGFVFANRAAKGELTTAAMVFAAKAIAAGIKASQLGDIAKKVTEAKKQTEDQYDAPTFERCQLNPTDPACAGPVTRSSGSGLQEGGFGFGDNFGNNAFTPVGEEDKLGDIAPLPLPGDETVAGVTNPFADDAKAASGILDPAGAASVQPGAAGGAGGGGAPGAGGGSASLGNDTPGADDSKKENDIKANKADGKYNIAGGGAFQAIKPMKDENPFANLFDGKGGKLEEDRSIASGDIDGQDSGLFSKISKRYSQVQADKRIEARNIDE